MYKRLRNGKDIWTYHSTRRVEVGSCNRTSAPVSRAANPPGPEMVLIGPKNDILGPKIVFLRGASTSTYIMKKKLHINKQHYFKQYTFIIINKTRNLLIMLSVRHDVRPCPKIKEYTRKEEKKEKEVNVPSK